MSDSAKEGPEQESAEALTKADRSKGILLIVALFFVSYQICLSAAIWRHSGNVLPGFDDSYSYVFDIRKVAEYESLLPRTVYPPRYAHFKDLSYNYVMASASRLFGTSPTTVYEASFFAGKLVLLAILLRLLFTFEADALVMASMLGGLTAFSGTPELHGFYWVVPSFWLLCMFFFWLSEIADPSPRRFNGPFLLLSGILGGTLHALGPYVMAPLGTFLLVSRALPGEHARWRRGAAAFLWIGAGALVAALLPNVLASLPQYDDIRAAPPHAVIWLGGGWPDPDSEGSAAGDARSGSSLPGLAGVRRSYLRFVFWPPALVALLGALALVVRFRRWKLLALFLATLAFTLVSVIHPYASRTCLFLWPATLLVLGAAPALAWRALAPRTQGTVRAGLAAASVVASLSLVVAWHLYNVTLVRAHERFATARWDTSCASELLRRTDVDDPPVFYGSKYAVAAFLSEGLEKRAALPVSDLPEAAEALAPGQRLWAALDAPSSGLPGAEVKFAAIEALGRRGFSLESRDCGLFRLFEIRRP